MSYIGYVPAAKPLTSADITDGIITNADIASGAAIAQSKIAGSFGKVLQVVTNTFSTNQETNSTSFTATGLNASITPASSSNKILALASFTGGNNNGISGTGLDFCYTLYRNSTNLGDANNGFNSVNYYTTTGNAPILYSIPITINYLDSPSTTSSTTYTIYYKTNNASSSAQFLRTGAKAVLTLIEISG